MIHRYWCGNDDVPEVSYLAEAVAKRSLHLPIKDWTDYNLPSDILDAVTLTMDFVPERSKLRHRANVIRLHLLYQFGGVWMDHDFVLFSDPGVNEVAVHPFINTVCNCYMSFEPQHPLIEKAISRIAPGPNSLVSSGEVLLNTIFDTSVIRKPLPFSRNGKMTRMNDINPMWGMHFSIDKLDLEERRRIHE